MQHVYFPDSTEIMAQARQVLPHRFAPLAAQESVATAKGDEVRPVHSRRERSLRACHRFSLYEAPRYTRPADSGAYVPAMAARIENDPNLTDGARRCARKLVEEAYRRNRQTRSLAITASYIGKALGKCRRTVQRYLRVLEREGYVEVSVIASEHSRMCVGLIVRLLEPLFPRHHRRSWPEKLENPDATRESQNQSHLNLLKPGQRCFSCQSWAVRCMDGVFRSLMKTKPLSGLPLLPAG